MSHYFVRIGCLAEVHTATGPASLRRGRRVIVRTSRGLELGEVLGSSRGESPPAACSPPEAEPAAERVAVTPLQILRTTTDEDELLIRRLARHKREAVEACRAALAHAGSPCTLLDVDQLLDGGTLVLHFLGVVDEQATSLTRQIAERYESIVRIRHFAKLLSDGCGPNCGTSEGGGCGDACSGCAAATACATKQYLPKGDRQPDVEPNLP